MISHVRSEAASPPIPEDNNSSSSSTLPKRPRGRPRKHPIVEKPLIKRARGRPRLNPVRAENGNGENYDLTNLPYGDLDYLTMPIQEPALIEPYVEIKTEKDDTADDVNHKKANQEKIDQQRKIGETKEEIVNMKILENRIAKIGECTISVANH